VSKTLDLDIAATFRVQLE